MDTAPNSELENSVAPIGIHENVHIAVRILLTLVTLVLATCLAAKVGHAIRPLLGIAFFALVPGAPVIRWVRPLNGTAIWALIVPISLAINAAAAAIAVWTHIYHPFGLLFVVGAISLYGLWRPKFEQDQS